MEKLSTSWEIKPEFSIRIVVCDHYTAKPIPGIDVTYSEFRGSDIKQVPILRIFGSAADGQKACLHIHGVFPYFYLPCPTSNPKPEFLYQIAASLDKALNISLKQATSTNQHVYKITLVKGLPFYGYHDKDHLYLKVFLYSPNLIKQAVELCSNGAILGQSLQPHESHLNFTLQFFIDFNLFGMSNIDLQSVIFRKSGMSQPSNDILQGSNEFSLRSESICYYEADCFASQIINRQRVGKGDGIENPGLEEVWNQEQERRKQLNISIDLKSLSQNRSKAEQTESHYKFEQIFLLKMSGKVDKPVQLDARKDKSKYDVHYPAESMEGSQLFKAADVSVHLPYTNAESQSYNLSPSGDLETTIVDEDKALNSSLSLHYSQVLLDNEDLELVDMLQDMDEKVIEEDSVIATPAEDDHDSDDAEYSQVFNNETLLLDECENTVDNNGLSSWNDSFWDEVNIPQLDGTCDDEHVKKVRKRKMREFKLGLSRPKTKKTNVKINKSDASDKDEINVSRETLCFKVPLKKTSDPELESSSDITRVENVSESSKEESIVDVVNRLTEKNKKADLRASESYDQIQRFEPEPGPSRHSNRDEVNSNSVHRLDNDSSPEDCDFGITSFYDTSRLFDISSETITTVVHNNNDISNEEKLLENDSHFKYETDSKIFFCFTPKIKPPLKTYIKSKLHEHDIPEIRNQQPFYSNPKDVGDKVDIGHLLLKLQSHSAQHQQPFEKVLDSTSIEEWRHLMFLQDNEVTENSTKADSLKKLLAGNKFVVLKPLKNPPTANQIKTFLNVTKKASESTTNDENTKDITRIKEELENSQAIGLYEDKINLSFENQNLDKSSLDKSLQVTMHTDGSFLCFGVTNSLTDTSSLDLSSVEANFLTLMLLEIHTSVRGNLHPDPLLDPIQAVFINLTNDYPADHLLFKSVTEIVAVDPISSKILDRCSFNTHVTYVQNETDVFEKIIDFVKQHNPDILCGYEIEKGSWGYLFDRSQVLGLEIIPDISRVTDKNRQKRWRADDNDLEGKIIGRIIFNVWRLLRHELALSSYSFENCMYEILSERVPLYSYSKLWEWWSDESKILRWIPVEYYLTKLSGTLRILEKLDIINRTSELARLFGLQWWEVLSRGSQFRVESLMLRAARPLNLIALSPTVKQRAAMRAPECLPLIFEPESRFYTDPMIVLDFQSLYPSMMIAYNYCFSTCIGRIQHINGESDYEFGAWRLRVPKAKLEALVSNGLVHWSPVGVGFVKPSVRRGVLPALLRRILAARQAVKKSMKLQTDEAVKKAMHSRQLGLKLIANVTYGYTAANFSGRMPCVEVGDSVVAKGRETLERAIKLVQNNTQWNVKVVYGDTDSMFVVVPGASRARAFQIGQQIADAVSADNPAPVTLKLEKVYQPCILQTKKRYVGYMYESADQEKPVYEAKGIETVRRDGCPAGVKLLQRSLVELFESGDVSRVKRLVLSTLARLMADALPPQDLFFSREYHGPNGYKPGAAAPPHEIAKRVASVDPRAVASRGWRVRWQVCAGAPGAALVRLARDPRELLAQERRAHHHYYAARVLLPPLHRCLSLIGVDVFKWLEEVRVVGGGGGGGGGGLSRWVRARRTDAGGPVAALVRHHCAVTRLHAARQICETCCGHSQSMHCENTECPVLWRRTIEERRITVIQEDDIINY